MHIAAINRDTKLLEYLCELHADHTILNNDHRTPIMYSIDQDDHFSVKILVQHYGEEAVPFLDD